MPVADAQHSEGPESGGRRQRARWRSPLVLGVAALALVGGGAAWMGRERIAEDVIDDYLAERRVPASYDIVSLTPDRQVIENLVIGDPARPDLTVKRMVIDLGVGWTGPQVRRVTLDGARLFASYRAGKISLGALDPLVFTGSKQPTALPAINLRLNDARALFDSDYGRIGVTIAGSGQLDDGFVGTLAATAPGGIGVEGCRAEQATLYGKLTSADGAPELDGPLRFSGLTCAGGRLARADVGTRLALAPGFTAAKADMKLLASGGGYDGVTAAGIGGTVRLDWSAGRIAVGHDLALTGMASPQGRLARLVAEGRWRGAADGTSGQWDGSLNGSGLMPAPQLDQGLAATERALAGTLLAPLLGKARGGLSRALAGGRLRAEAVIRHKGAEATLVIPEASLAARSGARVLALSRFGVSLGAQGIRGLNGNVLAGGEGLPSLNGRIEQARGGGWTLRLGMADFAAGENRLAVPRLVVNGSADGTFAFEGLVTASGQLPGGGVDDLTLPLEGSYALQRGFALGTRCTPIGFNRLALSGLTLDSQRISLCPDGKAPMLALGDSLRIAARTGAIELAGALGESPATLSASGVVLRYPQPFKVENLAARIGTGESEVRLAAASLTGSLSGAMAGAFTGGTARLAPVPLDLDAISGRWAFADGALRVSDGAFTLSDRPGEGEARFVPLAAAGATLTLADNRITADAELRHRESGHSIAAISILHDLETAGGRARLNVPALVFDKRFQPDDLTPLAKGVVALADGTITGTGLIDWRGESVTSSGTFATNGFDFAAAFGPVRGLSGKVVFTDLLNLTTAPDQVVTIAAINPGVEVTEGQVQFELKDAVLLSLEDARFPFMGGTLTMRPLAMDFSQPEQRRYIFDISGLDAAKFVAQMELTNLSATGIFDGTVPVVFDKDGNGRIDGGVLIARPGGGNIAYIGELAYENLGTMGNYAFSALRSLDYRQMRVGLGGDLAGEIVTSFDFDGVRQGAGTSQNFVTRKLAKLPIRFKVNVRSENFYELATLVRSFWDADYIRNPQDVGLFRQQDGRLVPARQSVQPPESEDQP